MTRIARESAVLLVLCALIAGIGATVAGDAELEKYPKRYKLKHARALVERGEVETAIWYYINLYPKHAEEVLADLRRLQQTEEELGKRIKVVFVGHVMRDPQVANIDGGALSIDQQRMSEKARAADALIEALGESE